MKLERALLLSSQKQAGSWELKIIGYFFNKPRYARAYRFLSTDKRSSEEGLLFEIFCVHQEEYQRPGRPQGDLSSRDVIADHPHVSESFADLDALHDFQRRFQIDDENWYPVEE